MISSMQGFGANYFSNAQKCWSEFQTKQEESVSFYGIQLNNHHVAQIKTNTNDSAARIKT